MEKNSTTQIAVILALAFGLILVSIGTSRLVYAQVNTTAGGGNNLTGVSTGPGSAIPGNVTNPTNATSSPSAVGGGNIQVLVPPQQQIKQQVCNPVASRYMRLSYH